MNRILVVDDDLSVIAAYRFVLEEYDNSGSHRGSAMLTELDAELFGPDGRQHSMATSLRADFVDQGADAIEAVRKSIACADPYAMIFLDVRMPPGLDGYETAEQIRALDPSVQIVFVSAYFDYTEEELLCVAGPANNVKIMHKPVWPRELCSLLRSGIARTNCR